MDPSSSHRLAHAITMKPTSPPRPYIIGDDSKVNEKV